MDVLWQKGSATVQQVLDALPEKPALAYNSVLTTIRVLENKGYVEHVKDGRAHIYMPVMERRGSHPLGNPASGQPLFQEFSRTAGPEYSRGSGSKIEAKELRRLRQLLQTSGRTGEER